MANTTKINRQILALVIAFVMVIFALPQTSLTSQAAEASTLKVTGYQSIGSITQGSKVTISGSVSSNYLLSYVNAYILASDGQSVLQAGYSHTISDKKTYPLGGSTPVSALDFSSLVPGTYYFQVTAKDASGCAKYLIKETFTVKASTRTKTLIDYRELEKIGRQPSGTQSCMCFSLAYCRRIIDGKQHSWTEYNSVKPDNHSTAKADPSKAGYTAHYETTEKELWQHVYDELDKGNPVIVHVKGNGASDTYGHWITIIGYENVASRASVSAVNFRYFDSVSITNKTGIENVKYAGYYPWSTKQTKSGIYGYSYLTLD